MFDALASTSAAVTQKLSNAKPDGRMRAGKPAHAAAAVLLGEILARLPGVKKPLVQIAAASPSTDPMQAARALARSAAEHYGRTLLVSCDGAEFPDPSARGLSWLMQELRVDVADSIVQDSAVSGLYHVHARSDHRTALPIKNWLAEPQEFSMLIVASPAIVADPRTIDMALQCHGSILAVTAGVTRSEQMLTASRQLTLAGARLLGTVLLAAPKLGTRFPRLRRSA